KNPIISLSTAHPAKFGTAVKKAIGREPDRPESLKGLEDRETRCEILDAEVGAVKEFIDKNAL
ncbi:MAG: threonine synthase, partial [Desulfobulbaceae bacterium]|nr:threonine synthase [Desulfobulbaceae bacterium]